MNNVKKLYRVTFPAVEVACMLTEEEAHDPKKFLGDLAGCGWMEEELPDLLFSPTALPRVTRILHLGSNSMPNGYGPTCVPWLGEQKDTTIAEQLKLDEIQTKREGILMHIAQLQEQLKLLG